jgi:hypothetical protein
MVRKTALRTDHTFDEPHIAFSEPMRCYVLSTLCLLCTMEVR